MKTRDIFHTSHFHLYKGIKNYLSSLERPDSSRPQKNDRVQKIKETFIFHLLLQELV